MQSALQKYPADLNLVEASARVASMRGDWQESLRRWDARNALAPLTPNLRHERSIVLWHLRQENEIKAAAGHDAPHVPTQIERVKDARVHDLVSRFQSICWNCEFGLVQRRFQSEPLNLFRWTMLWPSQLIAILGAEFAGLGEIANVRLTRTGWGEYLVEDRKFGVQFHTFMKEDSDDEKRFLEKQAARLRWLRDAMINDLKTPETIFVCKAHHAPTNAKMMPVFNALRKYGPNRLLWVSLCNQKNAAGSVEPLADGLIRGYLSAMNPSPEGSWNIVFDDWISILEKAHALLAPDAEA